MGKLNNYRYIWEELHILNSRKIALTWRDWVNCDIKRGFLGKKSEVAIYKIASRWAF